MNSQRPWVRLSEVFDHFGYKNQKSALNAVCSDTFPVKTFLVGKVRAIHRDVYDEYFRRHREEGLQKLGAQ